jgi:tagaturonate epimerase
MIPATATPGSGMDGPDRHNSAAEILDRVAGLNSPAVAVGSAAIGIRAVTNGWQVAAWTPTGAPMPHGLGGVATECGDGVLLVGPDDAANAAALRSLIPWSRPRRVIGRGTSFGFGDRMGMATPGHVRAMRQNPGITPILAQQSARELGRTGRTYRDVLDAATFGAVAAGWTTGFGADADHLKTTADIDAGVEAGFTMFTADPIAFVPDMQADAPPDAIRRAFELVPWEQLEDDQASFAVRYPEVLDADGIRIPLPHEDLVAAAARFGAAVVHVSTMYRHLRSTTGADAVDFEVAVDEIAQPTTAVDHVYLATELRRLGVTWVSLAPRFVGRFEKGVDYIGDRDAFAADVRVHAAIARALGPYTISVHSGSDKFSIYSALARESCRSVHLKTSGTSYLEALRTIAVVEPDLLRKIWRVAIDAYSRSRTSYWVSASIEGLPEPERIPDAGLVGLLDAPDIREILHVTFGAILARSQSDGGVPGVASLVDELLPTLWVHREAYWTRLSAHFDRHLELFRSSGTEMQGDSST